MVKQFENLLDRIEDEGLEDSIVHYSAWEEIENEEFHKLREAYEEAHKALSDFLGV